MLILDTFLIIFDRSRKIYYILCVFDFRYTMEKNEKEELGNPMKEFNSRYIYLYSLYAI